MKLTGLLSVAIFKCTDQKTPLKTDRDGRLTFFPLAVVLFPIGIGERSSGQSHVTPGSRHTNSTSKHLYVQPFWQSYV